jgi:hypothetical protein
LALASVGTGNNDDTATAAFDALASADGAFVIPGDVTTTVATVAAAGGVVSSAAHNAPATHTASAAPHTIENNFIVFIGSFLLQAS